MNGSGSNQRFRAFTIVELLVVVAILAILSAILIPAIGASLDAANQSKSVANMREMASAVLSYASDNNQVLPSRRSASGRSMGMQYVIIDPFANAKDSTKRVTAEDQKQYYLPFLLQSYTEGADIWYCPANKPGWNASAVGVTFLANNQRFTEPPRFFGQLIGGGTSPGDPETMPKSLASLGSLAKSWMISTADMHNYPTVEYVANRVQPPIRGRRNYIFFDGHVETRGLDDLPEHGNMGFPLP